MKVILLLVKSSKSLFLIAAIASILTGLSSTMVIKSIHEAVKDDTLDVQSFVIAFLSYWLLYGFLSLVASYTVARLTEKIIQQLRMNLSSKILSSTFESIEHHQSKLLPILTEDIKTIAYSMDRLPGVTTGLATVIGILAYMIWYSPILSGATLILFVLVYLFTRFSLPFVRKYAYTSRDYLNDLFIKFEGLVFGIKELTLNRDFSESYLNDQIEPVSTLQNKYYLKENVVSAITNRSTDMILLLGMGILIFLINHYQFVSLPFFGDYITLVLFTLAPLSTAAGFLSSIKRIEASLEHIENVGITIDEVKSESLEINSENWESNSPVISLNAVERSYYHSEEDAPFTLGPINLNINKGDLIFLVGGNGSGKTTLAKMILGLYNPQNGSISYKGNKVESKHLSYYRSRFSAVFTDSYVFDQLLHIKEQQLQQKSEELIDMLELSKKVRIENGKFSSKRLSDGQKKRLSLIVSILEDKEVYLFDEWAANQDPHFKEVFYYKILNYLKENGKTVIVITHDDRYFDVADRIIKLVNGKIAQYAQ
ncbi:cyclic peptide export ABC transporter [Reichenbachiella ulvae]|uniref:Cyclic peptide export ABC transporter n=1 Tax=Reichenbachiella ulvae TaxID=2980104 RepID=A0ABT3CU65_9BACT|nr:cyclic peptide export ABC transporter [Reichenbachiella ulvae]MCV9387236.1 cyclic peptide export ABC transporter [Reichenbachiella ulvae]